MIAQRHRRTLDVVQDRVPLTPAFQIADYAFEDRSFVVASLRDGGAPA
jgi:hypothetical protein